MPRPPAVTRPHFIIGLALVGIGHLTLVVFGVKGWPIALGLYVLGLSVWARLWFLQRHTADAVQRALSDALQVAMTLWRDAWRFLRSTVRTLWPETSRDTRLRLIISLNAVLIGAALWLPEIAWLWLMGSAATLLILRRTVARPRPIRSPAARPWRPSIIGLIVALSLMVIGHSLINSSELNERPLEAQSLGQKISDALHLDLPIDPDVALGGLALLSTGVLLLAWTTRRGALIDQPEDFSAPQANDRPHPSSRAPILLIVAAIVWGLVLFAVADGATGWTGVLPWLITLSLCGLYWWRSDRQRGVRLAVRFDRREAGLLALAAIALLVILSYQLSDVPASIGGDEGEFFSAARGLAFDNAAYDFFGMGVYTFPIPSSLYQSVWLRLLGVNIEAWRFSSVFAAVMGMVPVYFLAHATLGRRVAWLSLALFAVMPYTLKYARMGYNNTQSILPVALTLLFLWLAVRRDSRWFSFLAGCAAGLGFLVYSAGKLGAVVGVGLLAWWWLTRQLRGRTALTLGAVFLSGVVLVAAPSTIYGVVRYPDYFSYKSTESLINNTYYGQYFYTEQEMFATHPPIPIGGQVLFYDPGIYAALVARGLVRTTLGLHMAAINDEYYMVGALADPIGILYLIGLGWCLTRLRRANWALWLGWLWVGGFLLSVLSTFPPRGSHLVPIIPVLAVLGALGLVALVDVITARFSAQGRTRLNRLKSPALLVGVATCAVLGWQAYFVAMPQHFPANWENVIFWQIQHLPRGTTFVLIQPNNVPDDYEPWNTLSIDTGQIFKLVKPEAVPTVQWTTVCPQPCRVYFLADVHDQVTPQLEQALGAGTLAAYFDDQSMPHAYSFEPKRTEP